MKRFIKSVLLFAIFAIVGYFVLLLFWGLMAPRILKKNIAYRLGAYGYSFTRLKEADTVSNVDVLFIGSSHSYRGFDPRIFAKHGLRTFNLGTSSQTPLQTKVLLDRYLDRIRPKMVLLDVYPVVFGNDGVESTLDLIASDTIDDHIIKLARIQNNLKVYNTLIYGLFRQKFRLNSNFKENLVYDKDRYISGGYVETFRVFQEAKRPKISTIVFNKEQLEAFNEIINMLKNRNIPYLIVQSPISRSSYLSYKNNSFVDSVFRSFGQYYNANTEFRMGNTMFFDAHHLNQYGVEKYNGRVIAILDSITNSREEPINILSKH